MTLKKFQKSFSKSVKSVCKNNDALLLFGVVVVLLVGAYLYNNKKSVLPDRFTTLEEPSLTGGEQSRGGGVEPTSNEFNNYASVSDAVNVPSNSPSIDPKELLPKDENKEWSELNPISNVGDGNLLTAGPHNFLKQTDPVRNANLQLRSDPQISQNIVSPWNNTTISPDTSRVAFEIQR